MALVKSGFFSKVCSTMFEKSYENIETELPQMENGNYIMKGSCEDW